MKRAPVTDRDFVNPPAAFSWRQSRDVTVATTAVVCLSACLIVSIALLSIHVAMTIA
jgi:hypothetical protein